MSAVNAAKSDAQSKGATDVGALDSDDFSSLDGGNYVIYAGVFDSKKQAKKELRGLKADFPGAKVVQVSAGGGLASEGDAGALSGKKKSATVGKEQLEGAPEPVARGVPEEGEEAARRDQAAGQGAAEGQQEARRRRRRGGDRMSARDTATRGRRAVRRGPAGQRERLADRLAELQWDLGGLTYEMAIRDHFRLDVLVRAAAELQRVDAELGEVERLLRMERSGAAGECPACGALHGRGAVYCWQCGAALMESRRPSALPSR